MLQHEPEAAGVVVGDRVAAGAATDGGAAVPRPAAQGVAVAVRRAARIDGGAVAIGVDMEPVVAPLPDVAVHVVQAERIGWERADRRGLAARHALAALAVGLAAVVVGLVR